MSSFFFNSIEKKNDVTYTGGPHWAKENEMEKNPSQIRKLSSIPLGQGH